MRNQYPHHTEPIEKLNTMRKESHTTYNINYHCVWIPKYRRRILQNPRIKEILTDIIKGRCEENDWQVLAFEIQPDHIHLFVSVPPKESISWVVKILKGNTALQLRRVFPALNAVHTKHLWAKGFFASTAGYISEDSVKRYIDEQEHHRLRDEWQKAHPLGKQFTLSG